MNSRLPFTKTNVLHAAVALAILLASAAIWSAGQQSQAPTPPPIATTAVLAPSAPPREPAAPPPQLAPEQMKTFADFRAKPFAPVRESARHEWTAKDRRNPDAILDLAHNELEVDRLMKENERIQRRQLVYRKEPAWVLVERARATGEPLRKLTLPAFDGQEVEVEVTKADLAPSGLSGTFAGRIAGRGASLATLAFDQGREAFTVMSPEDGTYLQGHPREPGEIIVSSFDPNTYQPLPGGEPIRTGQTFKIAQ